MSSRPGILLAALLGSFAVVLALGAVVGTSAAAPDPAPTVVPTAAPTTAGQDRNSVRIVVGPGRLKVDGEAVEVFPGVRVLARSTVPEIRLCLSAPAGSWQPDGRDWAEQPGPGGTMLCRPTGEAELEQPVTIELTQK